MKGIILAGGTGSRLAPMTWGLNKHLLPVYDKPMIYYPISTLMLSDIRNILLIARPEDIALYKNLLGNGSAWGITLQYATQEKATGIAEAFIIGEDFIGDDSCSLVLGDNIFFGHGFGRSLTQAVCDVKTNGGATIFGVWVPDPKRFGVINLKPGTDVITSIEEKPAHPQSHHAVPGLYFYDNSVINIAKNLKPSERGELEITDVNKVYLAQNKLRAIRLERGFCWYDTGLPDALLDAATFIGGLSRRQGLKIACPEEIAWRKEWIDDTALEVLADKMKNAEYGQYLHRLLSLKGQ